MILSTRTISSILFNKPFVRKISVCQLLRNHYKALELSPSATQEDIKSAYFKLSKKFHPDLNNNSKESTEKFREITAAYEILGNERSRKEYDLGNKHLNIKTYRKSDIDEEIFRTRFYRDNLDPWDTGQNRKKQKQHNDKVVPVNRRFKEVIDQTLTEKYHTHIQAILFFLSLCLSALIGQTFRYFDLRTEFVEQETKKQMEYFNERQPGNSQHKVLYIFEYSE